MSTTDEAVPTKHRGDEAPEIDDEGPSEQTPLIPREDGADQEENYSVHPQKATRRRWPSLLALLILCIVVVLIIVVAFVAPSAVEQYASQAVVFQPTSLSIDSFTTTGVRARVQGTFTMDASRVSKKSVRDLGRFCTWIARAAESGESDVKVSLPEYGDVLLGIAHVPPITLDIRDGHENKVDFLTNLDAGDVDGIRGIANDWVDGRLGQLRVRGVAEVPVKSGIFSLGTQTVIHELIFANKDIPTIPAYQIKKLNFREIEMETGRGMAADVSLLVQNDYPVAFTVPSLSFRALVDNCEKNEPYIKVADAITQTIQIEPKQKVEVNVTGVVHQLAETLIQDCPGSTKSPLDVLLGRYIHGEENTVYIQGSDAPLQDTPPWITDLITDITVPVPVPGRTFGHLIKNFSLEDTHFSLPDPLAEPDTPEANPQISAKVKALVALPEEMNFNLSVSRVRADADVFYKGKKLGQLDLRKWQQAHSTRVEPDSKNDGPIMLIESMVEDAPVHITDEDVFTDVIQQLIFTREGVIMHIKAEVDVEVETALGRITIRKIPAEGQVPLKPIYSPPSSPPDAPGHGKPQLPSSFKPKIVDLRIADTTSTSLTINALVNMTNPTNYSASVPYVDIHILKNGSVIGRATARNLTIVPGRNGNINVSAIYDPLSLGGRKAKTIGRELLSQYISGWDTNITLRAHNASFPGQTWLGRGLSRFPVEVAAPHLPPPTTNPDDPDDGGDDDDEDRPAHFIRDATMHLFSSTATFLLLSPLRHSLLYVTSINATALYPSTPSSPDEDVTYDPVGKILYDLPFAVPPVASTPNGEGYRTPGLPVDWSLGSVGYDAVRKALGGQLRLAAEAEVGIRLGRWEESVWFQGKGIGAHIRW